MAKEKKYYAYAPKKWWDSFNKGDAQGKSESMAVGDSITEIRMKACRLASHTNEEVEIWNKRGPIADTEHKEGKSCKIAARKRER